MPLNPGTTLGPYEILSPIGAGGMGEVYKARDTRLDRTVAIKVLPEHVASDPDLKQRFEREAKTISSLNHPHICTLYDIGSQDGIDFLVMEYLDGETLAQRLEKGALPLDQALTVAIEIADALDKAHRQGIVHRDLKPGNIMLTKAGAKLLDFGLAKLRKPGTIGADGYSATTESAPLTARGSLLGTLPYMAPEQLEGKEADHRTDIFAFGALVYEMATGQRASTGDSQASLIAAILERQPVPMSTLRPLTPTRLDEIVGTCLAKDPDDRWQSAGDVARQLQWITSTQQTSEISSPVAVVRRRGGVIAAGVVAAVIVVAIVLWTALAGPNLSLPTPSVTRTTIAVSTELELVVDSQSASLALSPDGLLLAFVGRREERDLLYLRPLDSFEATPLAGTDGAEYPFFSPDGQAIAFFADGQLQRVSVLGGTPVRICSVPSVGRGGTWGSDGTIVFDPGRSGLMRVAATGGTPEPVTSRNPDIDAQNHTWPRFLAGSGALLSTVGSRLFLLSPESGEWEELGPGREPTYVPSGHLVYHAGDGEVHAVAFDLDSLKVTGVPASVLDGVFRAGDGGGAFFRVAQSGTLVYVPYGIERRLVRVDRDGVRTPLTDDLRGFRLPRFSPDGRHVAVAIDPRPSEVWVYDLERQSRVPLAGVLSTVWTRDGRRVAFALRGDLAWQAADGSTSAEVLLERPATQFPMSWSPDGRLLTFDDRHPTDGYDIWVLPVDGEPRPLVATPADETNGEFSPDGRWLAYESDVSGRVEVYVRPFPEVSELRVPISTGGGHTPVWSPDATEIFYMTGTAVMVVSVQDTGDTLVPGLPEQLFSGPFDAQQRWNFDVAPDGASFVMVEIDPDLVPSRFQVVQHWFDELQRLVPTP